jgi:putative peptidoglycan lipid II flippase
MLRAVTGVGLATAFYKALAAVQQIWLARVLGATEAADAFFLAQVLPVLAAGLAYSALCSSMVYLLGRSGEPWSQGRISAASLQVAVFFVLLTLVLHGTAEWGIRMLAPGSSAGLVLEGARIQRILTPILLFQSTGGMLAGILLSRKRVLAPPLSLCLLYVSGLAGLWMTADGQATRLAEALAIGAALQAVALWLALGKENWLVKPEWRGADIRALASQALPALGCNAISMLFLVTDRSFASTLGPGQIAGLSYVYSLITMPTQILVNTVIGVCMPGWVRAGSDPAAFTEAVTRGLSLLSFALLPIAIAIALGADPVTRLVLGMSRFTPQQIGDASGLLALYCPAILGFAAKDALTAAIAAQGRPLAAFAVGLGSLALSVFAKIMLVPSYGLAAIAHGTNVSLAVAIVGLLAVLANGDRAVTIPRQFWRYSKGSLFSAVPALAVGVLTARLLPETPQSGWAAAAAGLLAYAAVWLGLGGPAGSVQLIRGRW